MAKLAENSYRDVNIAFANELSLICERLGLDVWEIRQMANHHPRVDILRPGPGVGGHCIAVDPWFIIDAAPDLARLTRTARTVNDARPAQVAAQIIEASRQFPHPRIACLGLAFKPNVADMRESPALSIVRQVAGMLDDADILVAEPYTTKLPSPLDEYANISLATTANALDGADIVALLVDHDCFATAGKEQLAGRVVIDTRGMWRR
jgi:UDP-N-acetyl-D-mannosaminuronic acid dehydrogenase